MAVDHAVRQRRHQPQPHPSTSPTTAHPHAHGSNATGKGVSTRPRRLRVPRAVPLVVGIAAFYIVVLATLHHFITWLPAPTGLEAPPHVFSEARTRVVLEDIMSFGYRPVGSVANEKLTPEYLLTQIKDIKAETAAAGKVLVEVDVQRPTGAFGLDFLSQFQNIYANITNIVVRVSRVDAADALDDALLISSHFDAAIGAAAASDDGVNVALMIELLRVYAYTPPQHGSLVFNFNGAEETLLQAAHGFITQHKWTDNIRAFINLEAAGAGGRALLFQTGSDELALAYAEGARHPFASIIAQELFQTGVIPADTDFRIYRDFGAVVGMDFAFINNGYVYHTMLDDISRIQPGSIQHLGDNLVGVIEKLTGEPGRLRRVALTANTSNTLFFDVAGMFMVSTDKITGFTLCGVVLLLAVVYISRSPLSSTERGAACRLVLRCIGSALSSSLLTGLVLTLFAPLTWYSSPYFAAVLFLTPALAGMTGQLASFLEKQTDRSSSALWRIEQGLFEAMMVSWMLVLVVMLGLQMISSYIAAVWIVLPLVGQVLCHALKRLHMLSSGMQVLVSLIAAAIPILHTGFVLSIAFIFFIPLLGRVGPLLPPDLVLSLLFGVSLTFMFSFVSRFFCFLPIKKLRELRYVLLAISAIAVVLASVGNPYSDVCPKRIVLQHVHRERMLPNGTLHVHDAGLWLTSLDFRGLAPIRPFLASTPWHESSVVAPPRAMVETLDIYGDLPYSLPIRDMAPEKYSWYLPAASPKFTEGAGMPVLEVISSQYDEATDRRTLHLHLIGPSHLNLFIDAKKPLTAWSIGNGVNGPQPSKDGTYILQFAAGLPPSSFHFWIEAESNQPIDVGVVGHYLEKTTDEMKTLLDALPSWMQVSHAVSTWRTQRI